METEKNRSKKFFRSKGERPPAHPGSLLQEETSTEPYRPSDDEVIERFSHLVYQLALARCKQVQDAEDIFQEVFLSWTKAQPSFVSEEHAKAWFIRVTCNTANSFWRKPQHRRELPFDEQMEQEEAAAPDRFDRREAPEEQQIRTLDLEHCLKALSGSERELIHLFYYEGMTSREIAEILNKKEGALRMQLSRARRVLKACLEGGSQE